MLQFESKSLLLNGCISSTLFITFQGLHYFEICPLLSQFFLLIINMESHVLYSYQQMRRDQKIKFTDKSKANLWIHLDLAKVHRFKGLTSPYIISYLHFLNLNNILTLPQTFVVTEAGFGLTLLMFAFFFVCQIYKHPRQFRKSKQMQAIYKSRNSRNV